MCNFRRRHEPAKGTDWMERPAHGTNLARFLAQAGERVLARWLKRLRQTRWGALPESELIDSMPKIIDSIPGGEATAVEAPARKHADHRYDLGYELPELLAEYRWLREEMLRAVEEEGGLPVAERTLLHWGIDRAAGASSEVFTSRREALLHRLRDQAEKAREESERAKHQLEETLESMTDGFFRIDRSFRFTYVNAAGERMLGSGRERLLGKLIWDAIPGSWDTEIGRRYRQTMEDGAPFELVTLFEPWGRHFEVRAFPGPGGISVYFRDITDRLAEEAERQRLLEVLEYGDACFVVDRDWRIIFVNARQEALTQTPRERSLGTLIWESFPSVLEPDSLYMREYGRVMRERIPIEFDAYYAPVGLWTGVTAYPTREGGIAVFFRDVTDRKRAEALQELLLGVVGHDLRNPLATIALSATRLERRSDMPEQARAPVERISRAAARMERLIADLLDTTRMQLRKGLPIAPRDADLRELLDGLREEFAATHPGCVAVEAEGDLRGTWDPDRLMQVLVNLTSNALEHGAPDERVTVRAAPDGGEVRVAVHNAGAPLSARDRSQIFEPFQRATEKGKGLGLGLYISRGIVEQHGGRIEVDSAAGKGTTFSVVIPRRR